MLLSFSLFPVRHPGADPGTKTQTWANLFLFAPLDKQQGGSDRERRAALRRVEKGRRKEGKSDLGRGRH